MYVFFSQKRPQDLGSTPNSTLKTWILLKFRLKNLDPTQNSTSEKVAFPDMSYIGSYPSLPGCQGKGRQLKGELQREHILISYERAFKMLKNDMYITGIDQVVLELLSFKVGSGNHQRGISLLQKIRKPSEI